MVDIQERLNYTEGDIRVAKKNLEEAIGKLISELANARERLREVIDDPRVAGVSITGIVGGRGSHIDKLCGEIEMGVKLYKRMCYIAAMAE